MKRRLNFSFSDVVAYVSLVLVLLEGIIVVVPWIVFSLCPELPFRPILSGEGLRWLFGTFVQNVCTPYLVWMLMLGISFGVLWNSRLLTLVTGFRNAPQHDRLALYVVLFEIVVIGLAVVLLAFVPHAVLLSAIGTILPSSFSASVVPIAAWGIFVVAFTYGYATGVFNSVGRVLRSMSFGLYKTAPILILYIIATELYHSLVWVLGM